MAADVLRREDEPSIRLEGGIYRRRVCESETGQRVRRIGHYHLA